MVLKPHFFLLKQYKIVKSGERLNGVILKWIHLFFCRLNFNNVKLWNIQETCMIFLCHLSDRLLCG